MSAVLRSTFLRICLEQLARNPVYQWGGRRDDGMDCSGFVDVAMFKASEGLTDYRATYNTDKLWNELAPVTVAELLPGDLVFYWGPAPKDEHDVSHVMVYAGAGICFGMAYGGPADVDPVVSRAKGHTVKVLPVKYRSDLAGFRRLPLAD